MKKIKFEIVCIKGSGAYKHYDIIGKKVYVNGYLVWSFYKEKNETPHQLVRVVLNQWNDIMIEDINDSYQEKFRIEWKKTHPRDSISISSQNWLDQKKKLLDTQKEYLNSIWQHCQQLPQDELLQLKMIALWIESHNEQYIEVTQKVIEK